MSRGNQRDWREICEQVLEEKNSERLNKLLAELLTALDERERNTLPQSSTPPKP
jgi:hypothetical protein